MKTSNANYIERRSEIENYFDRTAAKAWERLTSNAPVGRIRASVRAGRDEMRNTLLSWLPQDMRGLRLLDAGCGTGALALVAMQRGAEVVAIDLSPTLVQLGRERNATLVPNGRGGSIEYLSGDMLDDALGQFDHVVAMDSVIHYDTPDIANAIQRLAGRTRGSVLFTIAPSSPLLSVAHAMGRFFPSSDRSPALTPVSQARLRALLLQGLGGTGWTEGRTQRVSGGFYTSQAWEWTR
ncbi:MAG: magnesium protoporphyrin IX methyltransferase [Hydrogenophaga sp.]|uniref:magnesium protoporphyrin IX methyltransferase n=1 Tax=Hydrogenophaga sp. TaxID=1904254 RepID=UPI002728EAF0|nr:magnesium protoporphyrin IX methyltransferase [Hydrogenophaga sp.]MDO9506733.1 magnesium protoporphyrin IX methyltransferase [Hydrogenophaga sp.]MDP2987598.1 magnesium protoporphyrin IX methyltransferase [Hydrogenophaga sp.]MDP3203135.1 magnesium protoporphyrin IX methyltransferase [Hydrogenophaga sp.]MDP3626501.1 magnesium protoporphyrin IX methyltransferase [Hydrogenophaga sp.]